MVLKPAVGADHDLPGMTGASNPSEQPRRTGPRAALSVGLALAVADVQHLAGVGTDSQDRVVPELPGVPVSGALFVVAVDLADETVDVDHQRQLTRAWPGLPHPRERLVKDVVELADMPERERPQECPEGRWRHHPVPQDQVLYSRL